MRFLFRSAYTLVELLIAMTLSLLLLLGIAELFQRVGGSMNDTRSVMSASAHLNEAALLLRQDLAGIPKSLATKPKRIADYIGNQNSQLPNDSDGYLEIIEGPDTVLLHPYFNEEGIVDPTVGDVDDIIAFTTQSNGVPFRGLVRGEVVERDSAEIIWFVRGNTLFRRVRLIDDVTRNNNTTPVFSDPDAKADFPSKANLLNNYPNPTEAGQFAIVESDETSDGGLMRYDAVRRGGTWVWTTLLQFDDLARRARRFGHDGIQSNSFPYPLYDGANATGWYYLRMPTLEESDYWSGQGIQYWKTASAVPDTPGELNPDLWEQPHFFPTLQDRKSGSLQACVEVPRDPRAGEDALLTNVLSFDVKVWDPTMNEFVDLGTPGTVWDSSSIDLHGHGGHVWDSWTLKYSPSLPPYPYALEAVQITIRCFEPASRIIKQVTVVHRFE